MRIAVNVRTLGAPLTGVQRYLGEILSRWKKTPDFSGIFSEIGPSRPRHGIAGHAWEQFVLPRRCGGSLLWSPGNTGPVGVRHQAVTIHDLAALDHPEWFSRSFAAGYAWILPRVARASRLVITPSQATRRRLIERLRLDPAKVRAIPLGVDERFRPDCACRISALPDKIQRYVLCVGSVEPRKNVAGLLAAWRLAALADDLWLVVAGAAGAERVFATNASASIPTRVHFLGHVGDADLPALYAGAHACVYPSLYEGFGLPALEALASGVPLLASRDDAIAETVSDAALTVDANSTEALAEGLRSVVNDTALRARLRVAGPARASQFNWENTALSTWQALSEIAR
jgi:glycosyltransferase involved in cell wall biosynthesis